jgi:hypothetical protein
VRQVFGLVDFDPGPGSRILTSNNYQPASFFVSFDGTALLRCATDVAGPPPSGPNSRNYGLGVCGDGNGNLCTAGYFKGIADLDPSVDKLFFTEAGSNDLYFQKLVPCFLDSAADTVVNYNAYTWIDHVTCTSSSTNVSHTLANVSGCDSVVKLHLTLLPQATSIDVQSTCIPFTWMNGVTYSSSNFLASHTIAGASSLNCCWSKMV